MKKETKKEFQIKKPLNISCGTGVLARLWDSERAHTRWRTYFLEVLNTDTSSPDTSNISAKTPFPLHPYTPTPLHP
ncbi:MAG: hypothetical protein SAK29_19650 [Scytonema sp. PMC 1069.18]|nr:hypothetical protein [Scytonema sp. PMC 1069.18]MEC4880589.1 hypothetical protein [Scytonema sp. PMC 1070.18]